MVLCLTSKGPRIFEKRKHTFLSGRIVEREPRVGERRTGHQLCRSICAGFRVESARDRLLSGVCGRMSGARRLQTSRAARQTWGLFQTHPRHLRFRCAAIFPSSSYFLTNWLGVVLLEVGLWQRAITLEKNHFRTARDPSVIQAQLLKQAQRRLGDKMGGKYQEIVIACLTGQFGADSREDLKLQQAYRSHVVDVLEKIVEYI